MIDVKQAFAVLRDLDKSIHETAQPSASRGAMWRAGELLELFVCSELSRLEKSDNARKSLRNLRRRKK